MNEITVVCLISLIGFITIGGLSFYIMRGQQRTIQSLAEALEAREYEDMPTRVTDRRPSDKEPLSWHDH